jgi:DNA ligase D-like protein (predicted ligase)
MLATLTDTPFSDPDWIYERKLDGERCLVFRHGGTVRLKSRNNRTLNDTYPEIEEALTRGGRLDLIADGEIVAFDGKLTSFSRLQQRIGITDRDEARHSSISVYLYLFDLLHAAGKDVTRLPLRHRKTLLKRALDFNNRIRYTAHRNEHGEEYLRDACRKGWEGLIAKRADAPYRHSRSRDWLKLKCVNQQEFVIGGYTDPRGSRTGFGALLIGYYDDGTLRYAGKVGTGYTDQTLESLSDRLAGIERKSRPFGEDTGEPRAHWVTPRLVAQIAFTEWTEDGRLRHPRFLGLRRDKKPEEVVREQPKRKKQDRERI